MPVDFSIKRVPNDVAARLRARAKRHHRSLQGELRTILEAAAREPARAADRARETTARYAPALDLTSFPIVAPRSESAMIIRGDRDGRTFTVEDLFDFVSSLGSGTPDESTEWIRRLRASK